MTSYGERKCYFLIIGYPKTTIKLVKQRRFLQGLFSVLTLRVRVVRRLFIWPSETNVKGSDKRRPSSNFHRRRIVCFRKKFSISI